jgi:hypothetical protein
MQVKVVRFYETRKGTQATRAKIRIEDLGQVLAQALTACCFADSAIVSGGTLLASGLGSLIECDPSTGGRETHTLWRLKVFGEALGRIWSQRRLPSHRQFCHARSALHRARS